MVRLPPNLDEPIDLTNFVPRKDLPNNNDKWSLPEESWKKAILKDSLRRIEEMNKRMDEYNRGLDQQMYSSETLASVGCPTGLGLVRYMLKDSVSSIEYPNSNNEPWWKFW